KLGSKDALKVLSTIQASSSKRAWEIVQADSSNPAPNVILWSSCDEANVTLNIDIPKVRNAEQITTGEPASLEWSWITYAKRPTWVYATELDTVTLTFDKKLIQTADISKIAPPLQAAAAVIAYYNGSKQAGPWLETGDIYSYWHDSNQVSQKDKAKLEL